MSGKYSIYKGPGEKSLPLGSGSLAALAVLAMFGMLPFTQYLAGLKTNTLAVREFNVTVPPPQFTPPEPPPPEPPPEQEAPPEMDTPPPQLSLSQLNMALNPGVGSALAGDFALGDVSVNASETVSEIGLFEISDLDSVPTIKKKPIFNPTPRMKREKREGLVRMEAVINPDGTVKITDIIESVDPETERYFIGYFESYVYTKPTAAGKAASARLHFNVPLKWEN